MVKRDRLAKNLRNVGPVTAQWLLDIGITSREDLQRMGPEEAYRRIVATRVKPSRNLLYALIGAVYDQDWQQVADNLRDNPGYYL